MAPLEKKEKTFLDVGKFYTISRDGSDSQSKDDKRVEVKAEIDDTVDTIIARISSRKLPPMERNFKFFGKRSLCGEGMTPHVIRVEKIVNKNDCERFFGKPLARRKYRFSDCRDLKVCSWILKIWPLIYTKTSLQQKLLLEFTMAIVAETQ